MAIAKKGLRKITFDGVVYFWKFDGLVSVFHFEDKNTRLIIDFGWFDEWLYVKDIENRPPEFEPKIVTPKFVCESISYAIRNGWSKGSMELVFKEGKYKIKNK